MSAIDRSLSIGERIDTAPSENILARPRLARIVSVFLQWRDRVEQRRHLSRLTPWELDDVGIGRDAAAAEAARPFWRA